MLTFAAVITCESGYCIATLDIDRKQLKYIVGDKHYYATILQLCSYINQQVDLRPTQWLL